MNWHKALLGLFVSLGGSAATMPFPWNVIAGITAAAGAGALVRPSRISKRTSRISAAIPGRDLSEQDKRVDQHGAELAELMDRAQRWNGEISER